MHRFNFFKKNFLIDLTF